MSTFQGKESVAIMAISLYFLKVLEASFGAFQSTLLYQFSSLLSQSSNASIWQLKLLIIAFAVIAGSGFGYFIFQDFERLVVFIMGTKFSNSEYLWTHSFIALSFIGYLIFLLTRSFVDAAYDKPCNTYILGGAYILQLVSYYVLSSFQLTTSLAPGMATVICLNTLGVIYVFVSLKGCPSYVRNILAKLLLRLCIFSFSIVALDILTAPYEGTQFVLYYFAGKYSLLLGLCGLAFLYSRKVIINDN